MFASFAAELPDYREAFARGEFRILRDWLADRVHRHAGELKPAELMPEATGGPLDARHFISYVEEKFGEVYRL
jgi:carboxypeptidase Taq